MREKNPSVFHQPVRQLLYVTDHKLKKNQTVKIENIDNIVETTIESVAPPVPMRQLSMITTNRIE
jgi:hypothetical protein